MQSQDLSLPEETAVVFNALYKTLAKPHLLQVFSPLWPSQFEFPLPGQS